MLRSRLADVIMLYSIDLLYHIALRLPCDVILQPNSYHRQCSSFSHTFPDRHDDLFTDILFVSS